MEFTLLNWPVKDPLESVSHAALSCYMDKMPEWGKKINAEDATFSTGHHTTFQHTFFTFFVEGISVGDVTFGLHLANPFYNTDQRSGRFCAAMFSSPNYQQMRDYIASFWDIGQKREKVVMDYIRAGVSLYSDNIKAATKKVDESLREERPNANEKYRQQNAPKIAQEQLRVFVPVIFPTGLEYTINLSALAAMYRSAWSPVMEDASEQMKNLVLDKWPDLSFVFPQRGRKDNSILSFPGQGYCLQYPELSLISRGDESQFIRPDPKDLHPIDLLHFLPKYMTNNTEEIKTEIEISVATMGQDQRHRTIRRSQPNWTGNFYLPPIPCSLELGDKAIGLLDHWREISRDLPESLATTLAPYGAMVRYKKSASYNGAIHELGKRLCWCAQEEIYHLARSLREKLCRSPLQGMFTVPCVVSGKCGEGSRYCGRSMEEMKENPFPPRWV